MLLLAIGFPRRQTPGYGVLQSFLSRPLPPQRSSAFQERLPETKFYANSKVVGLITNDAEERIKVWKTILGDNAIVDKAAIPIPYDFTLITLPGDEWSPIYLISALVADTIDETLFWIPSISSLIAGDSVYGHTMHMWLVDLLSPA
ncbi:hypothetical protein ACHAQH_005980 [Verticillium albo-atrum]